MPGREIAIPVLTLKSGGLNYKKKKEDSAKNGEQTVAPSDTVERIYPKIIEEVGNKVTSDDTGCSLIYEEHSSRIYFKIPDYNSSNRNNETTYTMLECVNISAADMRISSKYGWETMICRLLIECDEPLNAWSSETNAIGKRREGIPVQQDSCLIKATINVSDLNELRHVLYSVKIAQLKERKSAMCDNKNGDERRIIPSKIREGLPEWVNYVPSKWYSSTLRKVIEYLLFVYTVLTLFWAVWQLYKHVDFIRKHLRPILLLIEFYLEMLKEWFKWIDSIAEALTSYWWTYMKPIYLLAVPIWTSLSQVFKPLRNVAGIIASTLGPVIHLFATVATFLKRVFQPLVTCFHLFLTAIFNLWHAFVDTALVKIVIGKINDTGFFKMVHDVLHGGLDPIRAQFIVVRDILLKSVKQIYYGMRFIWTRVYVTFIFWKRERQYATQELTEDDKIRKRE